VDSRSDNPGPTSIQRYRIAAFSLPSVMFGVGCGPDFPIVPRRIGQGVGFVDSSSRRCQHVYRGHRRLALREGESRQCGDIRFRLDETQNLANAHNCHPERDELSRAPARLGGRDNAR